jgi:hypothetical protein
MIAKKWRSAVHAMDPDRYQIEATIHGDLDQKIDVVDSELMCAYEFKVSGKNAWAEFYKDVVKVIVWNRKRTRRLVRLVFITDAKHGRPFLDSPMPREYMRHLAQEGIEVKIEYVQQV